ncbi:single-stranded DNA-binding protein [Nocardioides acrostichi]|uniref:Single-stranded DNA-binding protein n=1 Tax=Nocardioides acrostichi TaxID=2784339 RepID=A0A930Y9A1_9ACTN|nr:single-stranded DNA-binding protein [Nocardioides acrostichi]MBF4160133.1 single-stranded DNA-binding protein [Nocardioides acrostichi]
MLNETVVTLQGWVGSQVALRQAGEAAVASFRVACTPRRFNRRTGEWVDGTTQWYTVNAWRGLADTCAASLRSGDPVLVHGRLSVHTWVNSSGVEVTGYEVEAQLVGHDLNRGTSSFTRTQRQEQPAGVGDRPRSDGAAA